jgi:hypothetical protein
VTTEAELERVDDIEHGDFSPGGATLSNPA